MVLPSQRHACLAVVRARHAHGRPVSDGRTVDLGKQNISGVNLSTIKMAYNYVVTAHKPTAVNACVTGKRMNKYLRKYEATNERCMGIRETSFGIDVNP